MEEKILQKGLLLGIGFIETHNKFFRKQAPGHLGHWTEVFIDLRFPDEIRIAGERGNESETLFRGQCNTVAELEVLLQQTRAI